VGRLTSLHGAPFPHHVFNGQRNPSYNRPANTVVPQIIARFHQEFLLANMTDIQNLVGNLDAIQVASPTSSFRVKAKTSLAKKAARLAKPLDEIEDLYGVRVIIDSSLNICSFIDAAYNTINPIWANDMLSKPTSLGYRGIHFITIMTSGLLTEIQVQTQRQQALARFTHDRVYKDEQLKKNKAVKRYFSAVGQYIDDLEKGNVGMQPTAEQFIVENDLVFDFSTL
jgi:ppGpp synthetase/RelA/SpoT-type nucleotidyltranferase